LSYEELDKEIRKLKDMRRNKDEDYRLIYLQIRQHETLIVTLVETNELYIEVNGVFEFLYKPILLHMISQYTDMGLTDATYKVIENMLKSENHVYIKEFDADPDIINLKNGLYSFKGWIFPNNIIKHFIKHDQYQSAAGGPYNNYLSFIQIPVDYDPNAEGLIIDQFLTDVFGFNVVPDVYEMIGYFLSPSIKFEKAFLLYGASGAGKTTFIDTLITFLGHLNIESLNLVELYKQFRRANLRFALLNIWDELDIKNLTRLDMFKIITTNEWLSGDEKYKQKDSKWKNRIKQLYSTNFLPKIPSESGYEFFRRWIIGYCNNDFLKNGIRDHDIKEKLQKSEQLSGLLNKAIEGWKRLKKRNKFRPEFDNIDKVIETWEQDRNPLANFVNEKCMLGEDYSIEKELLKDQCNKFRRELGQMDITMKMCTMCLKRLGIGQKQKRDRNHKRKDVYYGIKLKDEVEDGLMEHLADKGLFDFIP